VICPVSKSSPARCIWYSYAALAAVISAILHHFFNKLAGSQQVSGA